jgi:hypothetical protein
MKFTKKVPCAECPFRKTAMRGWLGPDTAQEVMAKAHGEGGYPCHMDMVGQPKYPDGTVNCTNVEQCAGAILHANASCKSYRDPDLRAMQDRLKGSECPILGRLEFLAHHDIPANREMLRHQNLKPRNKVKKARKK